MKSRRGFAPENFQRQSEAGECGLACLAMVASHHGKKISLSGIRRLFPVSSRGTTIKTLIGIADEIGFHTRALRSELSGVAGLQLPAIIHWDLNHYVVLTRLVTKAASRTFVVVDPACGFRELPESEFSKHFTGIALELTPGREFRREQSRTRLRIGQLWSRIQGVGPAIARLLILSLLIQAVALASPFYLQTAVDSVMPAQDKDLAVVLFAAFLGLLLISTASSWLRAQLVISFSSKLSLQTAANLFRHTIFLPILWFERRHLGDVISRFGSVQPINDLLSKGLVSSIVDGLLAVTTLCLMVLYSPVLTAVSVAAVLLIGFIKVIYFNTAKLASDSMLAAQAQESSSFIESIRAVATVKAFCQEKNRQRVWQNRKSEFIDASIRSGKLSANFDAVSLGITGLETLVFIYVAIQLAMDATMTLGMVFAFQAYKQNFMGTVVRLIDQVMNFKLLDVHLERLSDIVFATPDWLSEPSHAGETSPFQSIKLRGVCFRYARDVPLILENLDLDIWPGETTAIIGPSGVGKSTLIKVVCGLLERQAGEFLIDGIPLEKYGVRKFRNQLGVISQDDVLFSGSLAENITFFDPDYDQDWLFDCCRQAAIHDDIVAMPMGYETSVGDMGSNLSGGQKQRILLARALYKKPTLLVIDEGTAHLDAKTEEIVSNNIAKLGITRVIVAHRLETIRAAKNVLEFSAGRLTPRES